MLEFESKSCCSDKQVVSAKALKMVGWRFTITLSPTGTNHYGGWFRTLFHMNSFGTDRTQENRTVYLNHSRLQETKTCAQSVTSAQCFECDIEEILVSMGQRRE